MLTAPLAHAGQPLAPHDLWTAWNADPVVTGCLLVAATLYWRGHRAGRRPATQAWRARCFVAGLVALAVALLSPLDALSGALASAHMVQHLLLVVVAAPLLVVSAPAGALLRGAPVAARPALALAGGWLHGPLRALRRLRHPLIAWLLHVAALWLWHAAVLYDAAVAHPAVHAAEHATFLGTGLLFWSAVVGARSRQRLVPGAALLLVFAASLQGTFLSVLLTFARAPWYAAYTDTTAVWGLEPLADQQLAGVLMWVPAGFVYLAAALWLLASWLRRWDRDDPADGQAPPRVDAPRPAAHGGGA